MVLSIELYGAYFTENSDNARLLTLVMALEALSEGKERPEYVQELIQKWENEIKGRIVEYTDEDEKKSELESLRGSLNHMKKDSLRKQLYDLVFSTLQANGDDDATEKARMIKNVYDARSKLVHEGKIEYKVLKASIREVKSLVERILKLKFLGIANKSLNLLLNSKL